MLEKLVAFGTGLLMLANVVTSNNVKAQQSTVNSAVRSIYDSSAQQYASVSGGLQETVLNNLGDAYHNSETVNTLAFYDYVENKCDFKRISFDDVKTSELELLNTVKYNLQLVPLLDNSDIHEVYDNCKPLKNLLLELDSIYESDATNLVKFESMYNKIDDVISVDGDVDGTLNLLDLTSGLSGDCSEATASYYSLLSYYGFDVSMRTGWVVRSEGSFAHAWLHATVDSHSFDVDPTFYEDRFLPLEDRGKDIRYIVMKDQYTTRK